MSVLYTTSSWQNYRNRELTVKSWYIGTGTFMCVKQDTAIEFAYGMR